MNNIFENIVARVKIQSGVQLDYDVIEDASCRMHVEFRDSAILKGTGYVLVIKLLNARVELDIKYESIAKNILFSSFELMKSNLEEISMFVSDNEFIRDFDVYLNGSVIELDSLLEVKKDSLNDLKIVLFSGLIELDDFGYVFNKIFDLAIPVLFLIFPYIDEEIGKEEGNEHLILSKKYERSKKNRLLCLSYHGTDCKGCGVSLGEKYGDVANGFIHVHHLNPISKAGVSKINPIKDLIPLCPNCHSVVHLIEPPMDIDSLIKIICEKSK